MAGALLFAALALAGLGVWLWLRSRAVRVASGLPVGRVAYVDTGARDRCERPLFSARYRLTGRPDYLVQGARGIVPVEVKSGPAPDQPYLSHLLQLAAYCLLVEEQEGRPPPFGVVKYRDRAFEVDYTPSLRARLVGTLDQMRRDLSAGDVAPSHADPARCRSCGFLDQCDRRLR